MSAFIVNSTDLKQQLQSFFNTASTNSTLVQQYASNPMAALAAAGVTLPYISSDLESDFVSALNSQPIVVQAVSKRSWYGSENSVACWTCTVGLSIVIYGCIAAAGAAAIVGTDGLAAPAIVTAIVEFSSLAVETVVTIADTYGTVAALVAAGTPMGAVAGIGACVNKLVAAICNHIPNCCSSQAKDTTSDAWTDDAAHGDTTSGSPALAVLNTQLACIYAGDQGYLSRNVFDPSGGWLGPERVSSYQTACDPAAIWHPMMNVLMCCYVRKSQGDLVWTSTKDGMHWAPETPIAAGPAPSQMLGLGILGQSVYCVYVKGANLCVRCFDGDEWSSEQQIADYTSSVRPSLCNFGDKLLCIYKGTVDNGLRMTSTAGDGNWSTEHWLPDHPAGSAPALAGGNGNSLYCMYKGATDNTLRFCQSSDGVSWSPEQAINAHSCSMAPSLASLGGTVYAAYRGATNAQIYSCRSKS